MNLEKIIEQWQHDSEISSDLSQASKDAAKLHGKYLRMLSTAKLKLHQAEMQQKKLLKDKWLYYNGKMSQQQIDDRGWDYDPLDGLKVIKGDMQYFYDADSDIQKSEDRIVYYKTVVDTLSQIIDTLKWRHQSIRNIIEWKKFEAGM